MIHSDVNSLTRLRPNARRGGADAERSARERFLGPALAAVGALAVTVGSAVAAPPQYMVPVASFGPCAALVAAATCVEARSRPFSLHLMHLLFIAMFFVAAPLVQCFRWAFPVLDAAPFAVHSTHIFAANAAVVLWLVCYLFAYSRARRRVTTDAFSVPPGGIAWPLISGASALAILAALGTFGIVTRSGFNATIASRIPDSSAALILGTFVRAVPVGSIAVLLLRRAYRKPVGAIITSALIVAYLLLDNPLAAARFSTAAVVIGFLCVLVLRKRRTGSMLVAAILLGNLVLLPVLNIGRYEDSDSLFSAPSLGVPANGAVRLSSGDFDAYAMLVSAQQYTADQGVTWGRQLLGVALFWVPRAWWPNKPIGSGHAIASYYRYPNENLSCPLPAEGLMNLGLLGLAAFAAASGAILRDVDDAYWARGAARPRLQVVYPFLLGVIFFVSRGDLLSGFAYTAGMALGLAAPTFQLRAWRAPACGRANRYRRAEERGRSS